MSLRSESLRAYRQLYRAASVAAVQCPLYNQEGLQRYVSRRVQEEAEGNRRRISLSLQELDDRVKKTIALAEAGRSRQRERELASQKRKLLRKYEQHVSQQIDHARALAGMLPNAVDNEALTSLLQVLAANVGNTAYQHTVESSFADFFAFAEKQAARDEATEEATSERQNRIMQQALLPYGERLLLVHRTAIGEGSKTGPLSYLSPWQVTEAIVGTRSGVTAHHILFGRDHVVVEIDETFNKQVIYLACTVTGTEGTGAATTTSESYDWDQEFERVDISESEEVRQTMFHSEFLIKATRLCDALVHETPLHPTRKTVLTGHAVGGAVSVIMALLLSQRGFDVNNVITFGAPKSMQGTLERYVAAINPIRVVLAGDPLVELPVSGAEGEPFRHVGEILLMDPRTNDNIQGVAQQDGGGDEEDDAQGQEPGDKRVPSVMSAEDLAAAMNMDNDREEEDSGDKDGPSAAAATTAESEAVRADDDDDDNDGDESEPASGDAFAMGEDEEDVDPESLRRIAQARYVQHFLVEDYIRHLSDPTVELTYAEGDDVWDEGEYQASMNEGASEPRVSPEERRLRDLRGAL